MVNSRASFLIIPPDKQWPCQWRKSALSGVRTPGMCKSYRRLTIFKLDPGRRMIARPFPPPHLAVDVGGNQPRGRVGAEQEMVDAQPGIARPGVPPIVPEGVDRLCGVEVADGVGPALLQQPGISGAGLRLHQRVVEPALGLVDVEIGRD